ncbi:MAG: response regulator transcription factor [Kofleriaceae bacterium]
MRVLIVEDYELLRDSLAKGLRDTGYTVDATGTGTEGLWFAENHAYDAVILDVMLPGMSGLDILKKLRVANNAVGVIVLTARDAVADRVAALDLGADDYVVKPFAFDELAARLRALVRRRYDRTSPIIQIADLEIDTLKVTVRRAGQPITLSAGEYALLEYMASRVGQVLTRTQIHQHVYDFAGEPESNVLDVLISRLRRKIDQDQAVKLIHTRRGQGYVLGEDA